MRQVDINGLRPLSKDFGGKFQECLRHDPCLEFWTALNCYIKLLVLAKDFLNDVPHKGKPVNDQWPVRWK